MVCKVLKSANVLRIYVANIAVFKKTQVHKNLSPGLMVYNLFLFLSGTSFCSDRRFFPLVVRFLIKGKEMTKLN